MSTSMPEISQYLTFILGEELFAIDVVKVREVLDYSYITNVPGTPDYLRGVINLRGSVIPVVDMRLKFGMEMTHQRAGTCIVVLEIKMDDETVIIGALADSVKEVLEIENELIEPAPRLGTKFNNKFLHGIGKLENKFIMILNIDKVFSNEELLFVRDTPDKEEI